MESMLTTSGLAKRAGLCLSICSLGLVISSPVVWAETARLETARQFAVHVYANPSVSSRDLTIDQLRAIFSMRISHWPDDSRLQVFVLPDTHPLHRRFCIEVLGVFPYQLRTRWDRSVFSGTGRAPVEVPDEQQMLRALQDTPGAIGYLPHRHQGGGLVDVRD